MGKYMQKDASSHLIVQRIILINYSSCKYITYHSLYVFVLYFFNITIDKKI